MRVSKARIWELDTTGQVKQHEISMAGEQDISEGENSGDGGAQPVMRPIFSSKIRAIDDKEARYVLGEVLLSHTQRQELNELRNEHGQSQSITIDLTPS